MTTGSTRASLHAGISCIRSMVFWAVREHHRLSYLARSQETISTGRSTAGCLAGSRVDRGPCNRDRPPALWGGWDCNCTTQDNRPSGDSTRWRCFPLPGGISRNRCRRRIRRFHLGRSTVPGNIRTSRVRNHSSLSRNHTPGHIRTLRRNHSPRLRDSSLRGRHSGRFRAAAPIANEQRDMVLLESSGCLRIDLGRSRWSPDLRRQPPIRAVSSDIPPEIEIGTAFWQPES